MRRAIAATVLAALPAASAAAADVRLTVPAAPVSWSAYPLSTGVPLPLGDLREPDRVRLREESGREVDVQATALARWPDGSVKSLLVQFVGPLATEPRHYVLEYGTGVRPSAPASRVQVQDGAAEVTVTTGPLELRIGKRPFGLSVRRRTGTAAAYEAVLSRPADLFAIDAFDGQEYRASADPAASVQVEESGPVRAAVRVSGNLTSPRGQSLAAFVIRLHAFAGLDTVELDVTLVDPRPETNVAASRPQLALSISSYGLDLPYALGTASWSFGGDGDLVHGGPVRPGQEAYLFQTGRFNYDLTNGALQPYTFAYDGAGKGAKASGWADVSDSSRGIAVSLRSFWQQFPKEWSVKDGVLRVHLHPVRATRSGADLAYPKLATSTGYVRPNTLYASREGLAKTYELLLSFHEGDRAAARPEVLNRAFQSSPLPTAPASWYATSGVYGRIIEAGPWSAGHDDWLLRQIYETSVSAFKETGGLAVPYGWRDFGDRMRGGWCEVDAQGFKIPCFYNDTHLGAHFFFVQYLRTLDARWRDYAWNATRFYMDLGISHAPRRGYWAKDYGPGEGHLIRHEMADHASRNQHHGHAHLSGLADLYLLTGDRRALEVMRETADWWVRSVPDFFPVPIGNPHFAEAERDFAWPLFVLNEAYRGTGDVRYLKAGAQIVNHLVAWWQTPSDHVVAGKVVGRNDWKAGTGWWAMYPKCDNCAPGYNGTNPWMAGALLSSLILFYEHDRDHQIVDAAVLREMLLQTMNYVVKHGWSPAKGCFVYSEGQPTACGDDINLYFPLAYLYRLHGQASDPRRYDTAPAWIEIARAAHKNWSEVRWRGSTSSGFYGYEIGFMPEFFREMTP